MSIQHNDDYLLLTLTWWSGLFKEYFSKSIFPGFGKVNEFGFSKRAAQ